MPCTCCPISADGFADGLAVLMLCQGSLLSADGMADGLSARMLCLGSLISADGMAEEQANIEIPCRMGSRTVSHIWNKALLDAKKSSNLKLTATCLR